MSQAIIFDFDGTIADTLSQVIKILNLYAPKHGLSAVPQKEIDKMKDYGAKEILAKFKISPIEAIQVIRVVRSEQKKSIAYVRIFPGIKDVIAKLKKQHLKVGIVTSNSKTNVQKFLKENKIKEIDFIYSENSMFGKANKLTKVIKAQKLNKSDVIYVGDEVRDIEAAHKAGISVIAVTWGFNSKKRLEQSKPDYLITKPEQILQVVKSNSGNKN